jgi:hypothetical protein
MKKFISMLAIASMVTLFWACDDDETIPDGPTVTAPSSVTNVLIETEVEIKFVVDVPGG